MKYEWAVHVWLTHFHIIEVNYGRQTVLFLVKTVLNYDLIIMQWTVKEVFILTSNVFVHV